MKNRIRATVLAATNRPIGRRGLALCALAIALLTGVPSARADYPARAVYLGIWGGGNLVLREWDLGQDRRPLDLFPTHGGLGALRLGVHVIPRLAIEAEAAYLPVPSGAGVLNHVISWDVQLLFHILKGNWTPTLSLGAGAYHSLSGDLGADLDPRIHLGVGLRGLLARSVALRIDVRDVVSDSRDDYGSNNLEVTLGLDFFLWRSGGASDRDKDGIEDSADHCPDAAGPAKLAGCPDGDGDGIPDVDDRCPDIAGRKSLQGCTDVDNDGLADPDDQCLYEPAGKRPDPKKPGCPADSDADGVPDERDQCAAVPVGKRPDPKKPGCPADRDGDGVIDEKDACPSVKGVPSDDVTLNGCPADRDNDSVPDEADACPDKAGAPDPDPKKNGCPGLVRVERGKIVILQKVYFDTGKDTIKSKSFALLDAVVNAIKSLPEETRIAVEGHTDNQGKEDKNQELSQRRASAVVQYLMDHGISVTRLEAHGFGQSKPIASNNTAKGREENRRVEFNILKTDEPASPTP